VAQIGAAHGIRGEVRLRAFTAEPMAVADYGPLQSEDGARVFEIATLRPSKGHLVARLRGVDDREAAERLTNIKLYVPRERLPAPEDDDTFYYADLIGLTAFTVEGADFGHVLAVHDFGAGTLLEIQPKDGASVMLAFTQATVPTVDVAGGRVVIDPPEGMLDKTPPRKKQD
jgi:16S rRNA processing protein RimM